MGFNSSQSRFQDYVVKNNGFDPNQPRDDKGRWSDGSATGGKTINDGATGASDTIKTYGLDEPGNEALFQYYKENYAGIDEVLERKEKEAQDALNKSTDAYNKMAVEAASNIKLPDNLSDQDKQYILYPSLDRGQTLSKFNDAFQAGLKNSSEYKKMQNDRDWLDSIRADRRRIERDLWDWSMNHK